MFTGAQGAVPAARQVGEGVNEEGPEGCSGLGFRV